MVNFVNNGTVYFLDGTGLPMYILGTSNGVGYLSYLIIMHYHAIFYAYSKEILLLANSTITSGAVLIYKLYLGTQKIYTAASGVKEQSSLHK